MQKARPDHVTVQIAGPVHDERFHGRLCVMFESRPRTDIGNAAMPLSLDQGRRDVNAFARNHAILWVEIGGRKTQFDSALSAAPPATFNSVGAAQHAAGGISPPSPA